jgi:hypothetical protein
MHRAGEGVRRSTLVNAYSLPSLPSSGPNPIRGAGLFRNNFATPCCTRARPGRAVLARPALLRPVQAAGRHSPLLCSHRERATRCVSRVCANRCPGRLGRKKRGEWRRGDSLLHAMLAGWQSPESTPPHRHLSHRAFPQARVCKRAGLPLLLLLLLLLLCSCSCSLTLPPLM